MMYAASVCCSGVIVLIYRQVTIPAEQEKKLVDETAVQAQVEMAGGDYKKALDLYARRYEKISYPGNAR